jgi:N-acetylneuraminic acid mutarotase
MRESVALLLVLVFLSASAIVVAPVFSSEKSEENVWVTKASMHVARSGMGVAVVNGKIYAIGGNAENGVTDVNEEYDPATDIWTFKKPMPTPMEYFAIAAYQNKVYCIGSGVNEVYDPATDTWESKTPMPTPRNGLQANVVNGKIYLVGGYVTDSSSSTGYSILVLNEVYDPANDSWTTKAEVPTAVSSVLSAVVDSKIYVIMSGLNQIYDAETDTWSLGTWLPDSSMLYARAGAATGVNAPKLIYVFGGGRTQVYDSENDKWLFGADVPTDRDGFGVAVVNDQLYVIGGSTATNDMFWNIDVTYHATVEQYTPFGYGTVPPEIAVVSPENTSYASGSVSLAFAVNKPASWVGYSLDGQDNVTVTDNITLSGLPNGSHNVTVYARDAFGNTGVSETASFTIAEPFPTVPVAASSVAVVASVSAGVIVYFKKRKH